jgi:hypothetical protein
MHQVSESFSLMEPSADDQVSPNSVSLSVRGQD